MGTGLQQRRVLFVKELKLLLGYTYGDFLTVLLEELCFQQIYHTGYELWCFFFIYDPIPRLAASLCATLRVPVFLSGCLYIGRV